MKKYTNYIIYGVLALIALYFVITNYSSTSYYVEYLKTDDHAKAFMEQLQGTGLEITVEELGSIFSFTSSIIGLAYVYFFLLLAGTIFNAAAGLLANPKSAITSLVAVVVLAILFGIAYSVAGNEVKPNYAEYGVAASESQLIGGMITLTYILMLVAAVGIVFSEVLKAIR